MYSKRTGKDRVNTRITEHMENIRDDTGHDMKR